MLKGAAPGRLLERLEQLYRIGGGEGANRPGFSAAEQEAIELAASWMESAGLEVRRDDIGNLVGMLAGSRPELPEVWTGSHLDSVPRGGRFDGALGVVAGIEAIEGAGPQERTLGVAVFRAEETGCQGSRGYDGPLPGAFVELHVEQGPRLARLGAPLAAVPGIVGYVRAEVVIEGRAGHAGTTPMAERDDALVTAARRILELREAALGIPEAVVTVGTLRVEPGGTNVIPSRVTFSIDARAPDQARLDALVAALGIDPALGVKPIALDERVVGAVRAAIAELGLPAHELVSGAGHDAGILAAKGVPSAMLFVRSLGGGVSHSPDEHSAPEDVALAVEALARTLVRLATT